MHKVVLFSVFSTEHGYFHFIFVNIVLNQELCDSNPISLMPDRKKR